ncbi:hypothetical protein M0R45_003578 [Rubus argutus]|uniref:Uncharacterized protein n=1 Tax=Rubus argutus TaxID=59490 RepID=A0AAW1YIA3_RUBAR
MEEINSSLTLTISNPLNFVLLDVLPDLNDLPRDSDQLIPLVLLPDSNDQPRSSSVESLVLSDLNDEVRNPSVVPLTLFPDLNDKPINPSFEFLDSVDLSDAPRNPSTISLDLFPSTLKEDDKEDQRSITQSLDISTSTSATPTSTSICSSTTTDDVQEETVGAIAPTPCLLSNNFVSSSMDIDCYYSSDPPSVSIKRKAVDIDYSSPRDPNPKGPKRNKKKADPYQNPRKRDAAHPNQKRENSGSMDETLCRNIKVSIILAVRNIPTKEVGSLDL